MATAWDYIAIVIFIVFSAFFSGSEIAYASVNELRLKKAAEAENGNKLAKLAYSIYSNYDDALITILIGNNLVNIASSSVATVIAIDIMGEKGTWVATAIMTVIILTFGEIVPKIIAVQAAFSFTHIAAVPLKALMIITFPIVWLIQRVLKALDKLIKKEDEEPADAITEDDLETIIDTVEDEGVIDEDRADLLQSALDFDDVLAYEVITPRVDMVTIDIEDSFGEILEIANDSGYTRIPVYEDTVDNIIGILHLNHFYKMLAEKPDGFDIRDILMPVNFVHKTMPLDDVLKEMKRRQCHMVIVTDEYGGTMGCLTMEDVLEQIGQPARVLTSIPMGPVGQITSRAAAEEHFAAGRVVIFAAGTGNPFFSTDTTAALRAAEIEAEAILMAKKVDGVYDCDPKTHPEAQRFETLTFLEVLNRGLKVMDSTAISLCMDNNIPIQVFNITEKGNMMKAVLGEKIGTLVGTGE